MKERFSRFANRTSTAAGNYLAFVIAVVIVLIWAASGPLLKFSTTWQLVINTGTTIVTFLMVFLIQNSQNRESRAVQLKLDELIRAVSDASNRLIDVEEDTEEDLNRLRDEYKQMREQDLAQAAPPNDLADHVERKVAEMVDERFAAQVDEHEEEHHALGQEQRPTAAKANVA